MHVLHADDRSGDRHAGGGVQVRLCQAGFDGLSERRDGSILNALSIQVRVCLARALGMPLHSARFRKEVSFAPKETYPEQKKLNWIQKNILLPLKKVLWVGKKLNQAQKKFHLVLPNLLFGQIKFLLT